MKILQIFILTTTKTNHALNNAIGHLKEMVKNYEIGSYIESQNVTTNEDEKNSKKFVKVF